MTILEALSGLETELNKLQFRRFTGFFEFWCATVRGTRGPQISAREKISAYRQCVTHLLVLMIVSNVVRLEGAASHAPCENYPVSEHPLCPSFDFFVFSITSLHVVNSFRKPVVQALRTLWTP